MEYAAMTASLTIQLRLSGNWENIISFFYTVSESLCLLQHLMPQVRLLQSTLQPPKDQQLTHAGPYLFGYSNSFSEMKHSIGHNFLLSSFLWAARYYTMKSLCFPLVS
jgi:hypothetical protein